jgi:hypothetical protein
MNEEFAREIEWIPKWSSGAPCPQVLSNGNKTFLIYYIDEPDPGWDGTYSTMISPGSETSYLLALVEFKFVQSYRFGIVNDEAAGGHPLYGKGLEFYAAHIIENSSWKNELQQIHKAHPYYSELRWLKYSHYLLFFHDNMFEIIAHDHKIEVFKSTFTDLCIEVAKRLNS